MSKPSLSTRELLRIYACQLILMQDEIARSLKLNASDMICYNILNSYGSMSPGELANRSGFTTGGITKILDRLEAHGAIRRSGVNDRRALRIEVLSPRTSSTAKRPDIDFDTYTHALTGRYSDEELVVIRDFLSHGTETLQTIIEQLREHR